MALHRIIECVPNFSEGRRTWVIDEIVANISAVQDVCVMHVDTGFDANRTVVTFAGDPEAVCEAAFRAVKKATELIDMRQHKGVHPRMGATDVLPLIPVSGISINEVMELSFKLAERIGTELNIPIYCYENSSSKNYRKRLEQIRHGEYESLSEKMTDPLWKPDFGPSEFNIKSGATIVGARNFLVAYNINIESPSVEIAKKIAAEVRESGYNLNENGTKKHVPGILKNVKAIGWYIKDFDRAQVSMNLTHIEETPVHVVFETVSSVAHKFGTKVTGSELIGLIPLQSMLQAGRFFSKQDLKEDALIQVAIEKLGLGEIETFNPLERILEYRLMLLSSTKKDN